MDSVDVGFCGSFMAMLSQLQLYIIKIMTFHHKNAEKSSHKIPSTINQRNATLFDLRIFWWSKSGLDYGDREEGGAEGEGKCFLNCQMKRAEA